MYKKCDKVIFLTRSEKEMLVFKRNGVHEVSGVIIDGEIYPTDAGDFATVA